jgi:hypothetical protein
VAGSAGWGRSSACVRVSGWWGLAGREIVGVCEDFREAGGVGGWAAYRATLTRSRADRYPDPVPFGARFDAACPPSVIPSASDQTEHPTLSAPQADRRAALHPVHHRSSYYMSISTVTKTAPQVAINDIGSEEDLLAAIDATIKDFNDGDIVEGVIVKVDRDEVLLDIGYKTEGVIPSRELSIKHDVDPAEVVKVGDEVEASFSRRRTRKVG